MSDERNSTEAAAVRPSVSATPSIMNAAKASPAEATPLPMAYVITNSVNWHGISPEETAKIPLLAPRC